MMSKWRLVMMIALVGMLVAACGGQPKTPPVAEPAPPAPKVETAPAVEAQPSAPVEVVGEEESAPAAVEPAPAESAPPAGEQAVEGGVPKLVVPEPVFDFGQRDNSETVTHHFVLRNEGTGVLKIESVRASCGCTTTELPTDTLAPGEELKLETQTNLRGRQGPQTKTVTVFSNDPEQPSLRLTMKGDALASIAIEPMNIQFGRVEDDQPREAKVTIKSTKEDVSFSVLSSELSDLNFITHEVKEIVPQREYELIVKAEGPLPVGHHNGRIIVRTDSRERAVIWVPISMQVIGAVQVMPPVINIRYSEEPGDVEQQQLSITPGRSQEFTITEVVLPLEGMEHELIPAGANNYRLRLANMPRNDDLEGKNVILRTNIPDSPEILIPFNIYKPRVRQAPGASASEIVKKRLQTAPEGVEDVAETPAAPQQ